MNRINLQILLGALMVLITSVIVLVYGLNEEKRMEETVRAQHARAIEQGATLFEAQCSRCHGTQGLGIPGLCPPLNDRYFFDQRLTEAGWCGSQEDYIVATVSSGRLASTRPQQYPGQGVPAMPAFSEHYGGPLRDAPGAQYRGLHHELGGDRPDGSGAIFSSGRGPTWSSRIAGPCCAAPTTSWCSRTAASIPKGRWICCCRPAKRCAGSGRRKPAAREPARLFPGRAP